MSKKPLQFVAVFNDKKINGYVLFTESLENNCVIIDANISGLKKNSLHGFHIHESGDIRKGCHNTTCKHFDPYNTNIHGGPESSKNMCHAGDFGNLETDNNGNAKMTLFSNLIKLRGTKANILGRMVIIHALEDDLGEGENYESKINGNSGPRIACAIIGWSDFNFH